MAGIERRVRGVYDHRRNSSRGVQVNFNMEAYNRLLDEAAKRNKTAPNLAEQCRVSGYISALLDVAQQVMQAEGSGQ